MKRFLSLFIALILVFSMFTVTAVAFAEPDTEQGGSGGSEATSKRVKFDEENFKKYIYVNRPFDIEMSETFMFDGKITYKDGDETKTVECWYKDYDIIHNIFPGINYIVLEDEDIIAKDDEKFETATKYNLTYDYNLDGKELEEDKDGKTPETPKNPEAEQYQATEYVTLAKAPSVKVKDHTFAGWKIEFDGMVAEFKNYIFAAGFKFNMPQVHVTVTAVWKEIPKADDKEDDDSEAKATAENESTTIPEVYANDIIYVLYTTAPANKTKDWDRCKITDTFSITTRALWAFRFAVADGIKSSEDGHSFDWDNDILATTFDNVQEEIDKREKSGQDFDDEFEAKLLEIDFTLFFQADDTTHPEVELSESMKTKMNDGLTVDTSYTIPTSLDTKDPSSKTVTYKVYKKVGTAVEGADPEGWILIYDSKTSKVTEGYEDYISTSGSVAITPREEDVTGDYIYMIVYSVVDDNGYFGVQKDAKELEEYHPTMKLKVYQKVVEPGKRNPVDAWKIVLYVIAGLAAVGIVVLLCIKPKQGTATDSRYSASANESAEGETEQDEKQE